MNLGTSRYAFRFPSIKVCLSDSMARDIVQGLRTFTINFFTRGDGTHLRVQQHSVGQWTPDGAKSRPFLRFESFIQRAVTHRCGLFTFVMGHVRDVRRLFLHSFFINGGLGVVSRRRISTTMFVTRLLLHPVLSKVSRVVNRHFTTSVFCPYN